MLEIGAHRQTHHMFDQQIGALRSDFGPLGALGKRLGRIWGDVSASSGLNRGEIVQAAVEPRVVVLVFPRVHDLLDVVE